MTLPRSETPLRRSAVGSYRESMARDITVINDDEAERREARRRTLLVQQDTRKSSALESIEENEAIRSCVDLYNCNKLSKDNAWHMSLIDSLANLMDRHHKKLSNFKMAGSSLEASSKVYGLRVDSIYIDAMRISAGLSARTLTDKQINDADADDGGSPDGAPGDGEGGDAAASKQQKAAAPKPKRQKKNVSTLTKNKETLNARLDMMPMQDAVFGKLNSTVGSINASNRLMHNILPSMDSELRLRTTYKMWDATEDTDELMDSETLSASGQEWPDDALCSAEWLYKLVNHADNLVLRPLHTGYVITSAPNPKHQADKSLTSMSETAAAPGTNEDDDEGLENADDFCMNPTEISVAFDMNAECEPMPDMEAGPPIVLEIPSNDLEELTAEEQTVINNCRRLRKTAEFIDDLRPVDGVSRLDYSYRPMEQISQFWAGPAHWKFKRTRPRTTLAQTNGSTDAVTAAKPKKSAAVAAKRRMKEVNYGKFKEEFFQPLDANIKQRKANYQKKWDARKLMLPTKFNFEDEYFFKYDSAPSIKVSQRYGEADLDEGLGNDMDMDDGGSSHHGDADIELFDNEHFTTDDPQVATNRMSGAGIEDPMDMMNVDSCEGTPNQSQNMHLGHDTIVEIATEYEGAPKQVTKVIVPFAKRAKVIDMKNLKKSCNSLIQKQLLNAVDEAAIPVHPVPKDEQYSKGVASFQEIYRTLPDLLTAKMADSLSPSVALYAVLHLANDMKLRLIPQENLEDFQIRQVLD
ncbi:LOW QUALITY PROTEIN: condensin complex subunit 2 [Drosophila obscura]|uniref:LOW QUALITY PROTEIN: condensin complex subunit 2 n=1 Tax=Drosophila obscura TaxID=7282 RepID=UPI001BB149E5|nr:LOW QUALITY PROTEIN: condensin complex subunit 2 [Drosophila obscura]